MSASVIPSQSSIGLVPAELTIATKGGRQLKRRSIDGRKSFTQQIIDKAFIT
jgi:hypothetical protein